MWPWLKRWAPAGEVRLVAGYPSTLLQAHMEGCHAAPRPGGLLVSWLLELRVTVQQCVQSLVCRHRPVVAGTCQQVLR
jgi:hypothetical protein